MVSVTNVLYYYVNILYNSNISHKTGIYGNLCLNIFLRKVKLYLGKWESKKLRTLFDKNLLTDVHLKQMTYKDLNAVLQYDLELFRKISCHIYEMDLAKLKKQSKIRVVFFVNTDSVWSCDRLYRLFELDERFEPFIVVPGFNNGTSITIRETYESTVQFFKEKGYKIIGVWDNGAEKSGWDEIGVPDIIFHLTPYLNMLPSTFNIFHVPLSCLNVYIPYSLATVSELWWYNAPGIHLAWLQVCESSLTREMYGKSSITGPDNIVVLGHPKIDSLISPGVSLDIRSYWKIPKEVEPNKIMKIIYAPHHSISNSINYSTFHQNYKYILNYAKTHSESTSWIVRPHPLLKKACVDAGIFQTEADYDAFMEEWDMLPNARYIPFGTYTDFFLTSDIMITDCGSFILEYQYLKKPLIMLTRADRKMNELGNANLECLYQVSGDNIMAIQTMFDLLILQKNDWLKEKRDQFYNSFLNIPQKGGGTASENIYKYVTSQVS